MRQAMIDRTEELAVAIALDQAKHISEARGEVQRVVEILKTACSIPTLIQGETVGGIAGNIYPVNLDYRYQNIFDQKYHWRDHEYPHNYAIRSFVIFDWILFERVPDQVTIYTI